MAPVAWLPLFKCLYPLLETFLLSVSGIQVVYRTCQGDGVVDNFSDVRMSGGRGCWQLLDVWKLLACTINFGDRWQAGCQQPHPWPYPRI